MSGAPEAAGDRPACPSRPTDTSRAELGFERRPMVRWLDPHQLVDTAVRVLVSGVFSSYADSRELQALVPAEVLDRSAGSELWLDYVADLGDGWNPTYTVAALLAREKLELASEARAHLTERGRILVMGGDAVYPVPTREEYENRMLGAYRSALPCVTGPDPGPELFAIPGSHDWFDGLVNFTSVFCRGRWIGGWKTRQRRSYFAVKLPHRWWLWGVDIQFGGYLDEAQLAYFHSVANDHLQAGDRIILCVAKEVEGGRDRDEVYSERDVDYIEREVVRPTGANVAVTLQSGKHHYCRYEEADGPHQHLNSGGGGAFLHPTHHLPEEVERTGKAGPTRYRRVATYPSPATSRRLRKRVWLLTPYNLPLAGVFGAFQLLLAFMLGLHLRERHVSLSLRELWLAVWESPTAFLLLVLMVVSLAIMVRFAYEASGLTRLLLGAVHAGLQFASVAGVMIAGSALVSDSGLTGAPSLLAFLASVTVLGGLAGTVGMSGYLWVTNCLGFHGNEAYAPLHHMDLKHFLRLHIDGDGVLWVYPVGIDRVGRHWEVRPEDPVDAPWFVPSGPPPEPHLIEGPVRIGG